MIQKSIRDKLTGEILILSSNKPRYYFGEINDRTVNEVKKNPDRYEVL